MESEKPVLCVLEAWQSQSYWTIKGWTPSLVGTNPHFWIPSMSIASPELPKNLGSPKNWDWVNEWTLDTSGAYGEHDSDGWYYAGTFDGIAEMLKTKSGSAAAAKTSLVRKRRWVRSMRCTSVELTIQMNNRIQRVATMRKHVEAALLEKELSMKNVGFYEENRDFVFDQSLSLATRGTIATLATLKDLVVKLKRLSQFVSERAVIEAETAAKLEALGRKYANSITEDAQNPLLLSNNSKGSCPSSPASSTMALMTTNTIRASITSLGLLPSSNPDDDMLPDADPDDNDKKTSKRLTKAAADAAQEEHYAQRDTTAVLFNSLSAVTRVGAHKMQQYSNSLANASVNDFDHIISQINSVLKAARNIFRKNSDICRLCDIAAKKCFKEVLAVHEGALAASNAQIWALSEQLYTLKNTLYSGEMHNDSGNSSSSNSYGNNALGNLGNSINNLIASSSAAAAPVLSKARSFSVGSPRSTSTGPDSTATVSTSSSTTVTTSNGHITTVAVVPQPQDRQDVWLAVQRYRQVVRDSQEALCVLITDYMDLELHKQILTNTVHSLYVSMSQFYVRGQDEVWSESSQLFSHVMSSTLERIDAMGLPYPVLKSPFSKIKAVEDAAAANSEDAVPPKEPKKALVAASDEDSSFNSTSHIQYEDYSKSVGVFSFTGLYKEPLPVCPSVITSGSLLWSKASEYEQCHDASLAAIWRPVYAVVTSDGYLHWIHGEDKWDMPFKSFYIRNCEVCLVPPSVSKDSTNDDDEKNNGSLVIHLKPLASTETITKNGASLADNSYLRAESVESCRTWLTALLDPLPMEAYVDQVVEDQTLTAMLRSMPIIRGETVRRDLHIEKYQHDLLGDQSAAATGSEDGGDETVVRTITGDIDDETLMPVTPTASRSSNNVTPTRRTSSNNNDTNNKPVLLGSIGKGTSAHYQFSSPYMKGSDNGDGVSSWVKKDSNIDMSSGGGGGSSQSDRTKPKQIIPVVDASLPLARHHSAIISQYELGLLEEKRKVDERVNEKRTDRIMEVVALNAGDEDETASIAGSIAAGKDGDADDDSTVISPMTAIGSNATKKKKVKSISEKFSAVA